MTAHVTPDAITNTPSPVALAGFDPGTQLADGFVFGFLNGFDGADPAWAAGFLPTGTSLDLYVDEDATSDSENGHTTEVVSLLALSPAPAPPFQVVGPGPVRWVCSSHCWRWRVGSSSFEVRGRSRTSRRQPPWSRVSPPGTLRISRSELVNTGSRSWMAADPDSRRFLDVGIDGRCPSGWRADPIVGQRVPTGTTRSVDRDLRGVRV